MMTASTGRTRRSTTRSPCGGSAVRRTRSSDWVRSPVGTTARAATSPCGTPTCSARSRPSSSHGTWPRTTRAANDLGGVRPVLHQHPVLLPPELPGRTDGGILSGQRIPRHVRVLPQPRSTGSTSAAGSTPSTSSPGRTCRGSSPRTPSSPAAPRRRRCGRSATTSAGGSTTAKTPSSRSPREHRALRRAVRRVVAGHRVHGRLPGLHLEHRAVPGPARDAGTPGRPGLPGDHDHRPRGEVRSRVCRSSIQVWNATCSAGPRAGTSTSVRSGRATPPSRTSSPRRREAWWGELNAAHVRSGLAGDLERHERAGDRRHRGHPDAFRPRRVRPRPLSATSTPC